MIRRFKIETPEQLRALAEHCHIGAQHCRNLASVWNATRNRSSGKSAWDNDFSVHVESVRRGKCTARICKVEKGGACNTLADLRYRDTLQYCRDNLTLIEEIAKDKKE